MRRTVLLIALSFLGAALAGCATTDDAPDAPVPPPGGDDTTPPPSGGDDTTPPTDDGGDEPPVWPDCPTPEPVEGAGERLGYPELVFTAKEPSEGDACYAFLGPATASAGWTVVTFQNTGRELHIMPTLRLDEGYGVEDFLAYDGEGPPAWATPVGGVGGATPFQSGSVVLDLQEGTYLYFCPIGAHHMQGMVGTLEVTAAEGEPRPEPTAAYTVTLDDYAFGIPENLTAGTHVVAFDNVGSEPHEAPLVRLNEGVGLFDFLGAVEARQGPPPGAVVGGVNVFVPGTRAYAILDLDEATYGFVCFVHSPEHDAEHVELGMHAEFTVGDASSGGDGDDGGDGNATE